ncbi:MAG: response regulator transcription factor [Lachnospiraceae bacterium]|nr:response regulator transcription factor [Lachnospiraceae bacterium]
MEYHILLVEDDKYIREIIEDYFSEQKEPSFIIHSAMDGDEGMERIYEREYDLVLLDIMLPGTDGFEICREIRRHSICPIIFLTARGRQEDILYGYDLGCDDYIVKPFAMAELFAKVNAVLKRAKGLVGVKQLVCGSISMNPATFEVKVDEQMIELPPKEFAILKYLMEHQNRVVEREVLLTRIWGYDYEGNERVVDNHVKKLRKALGDAGKQIKTVITKGYKLEGER